MTYTLSTFRADLAALQAFIRDRLDEMRWAREVAYVEGPTCIQYATEPFSHADKWPMTRASDVPTPAIAESCQRTVAAVAEALELPQGVTRIRSKKERV